MGAKVTSEKFKSPEPKVETLKVNAYESHTKQSDEVKQEVDEKSEAEPNLEAAQNISDASKTENEAKDEKMKTIQSEEPDEESTISTSSAQEENMNFTEQKSNNTVEAEIPTDILSEEETKTESNIDNEIQKEETITNVPIHSDEEKEISPPEEANITKDVPIESDAERQIEPSKSSEYPSENIESNPPEEKLTEDQVKAMVAKVEGKCQNISSGIANMAMSEQYLRTKQAMLMAKKKEQEMKIAEKMATLR